MLCYMCAMLYHRKVELYRKTKQTYDESLATDISNRRRDLEVTKSSWSFDGVSLSWFNNGDELKRF